MDTDSAKKCGFIIKRFAKFIYQAAFSDTGLTDHIHNLGVTVFSLFKCGLQGFHFGTAPYEFSYPAH